MHAPLSYNPSLVQENNPRTESMDKAEIVGGDNLCCPQFFKNSQEGFFGPWIKVGRGLIQNEHFQLEYEDGRQAGLFLLPRAQAMGGPALTAFELQLF